MTERLLQFIWQFQYFNQRELSTVAGEKVQVLFPGNFNRNQGPDFTDAKIRIDKAVWAGSVELHLKSSDWGKHKHDADENYNNVVLHVVWDDDGWREPAIPLVELKDRIPKILLQRYGEWMNAISFIPCEGTIQAVPGLTWSSWKDRLLAERLLRKARMVASYLQETNYHWEQTCWWLLARNFGIKVNADAFEAIARSIPFTVLSKLKHQPQQLEALLMGQGGLLNRQFNDDYPRFLQTEYRFRKNKHRLKPISLPIHFLRMRPVNFPTIRLAQLAQLLKGSVPLFSGIRDAASLKEIRGWFGLAAGEYWHHHYRFDELSAFREKTLGGAMIDNIIINTICPLVFSFGEIHGEPKYKDKALDWLEKTRPESNAITREFLRIGVSAKNAFDSQALIELKNQYCDNKRCLECSLGNFLLKNHPSPHN